MEKVVIYTAEPCGFCRTAKTLLDARNIPYTEVNLTKDPQGRAELVELTGRMTFPQILVEDRPIGGFQELMRADAAGLMKPYVRAAAA